MIATYEATPPDYILDVLDNVHDPLFDIADQAKKIRHTGTTLDFHCGPVALEEARSRYYSHTWDPHNKGNICGQRPEFGLSYDYMPELYTNDFEQSNGEHYEYVNSIRDNIANLVGAHEKALCAYYPPSGFLSWHNNSDTWGFNFLLTYSESGDGFLRCLTHLDDGTVKVVDMVDKPGWQLRSFYFGPHGSDELWHACGTTCRRLTIAFTTNQMFRDDVINDCSDVVVYDNEYLQECEVAPGYKDYVPAQMRYATREEIANQKPFSHNYKSKA